MARQPRIVIPCNGHISIEHKCSSAPPDHTGPCQCSCGATSWAGGLTWMSDGTLVETPRPSSPAGSTTQPSNESFSDVLGPGYENGACLKTFLNARNDHRTCIKPFGHDGICGPILPLAAPEPAPETRLDVERLARVLKGLASYALDYGDDLWVKWEREANRDAVIALASRLPSYVEAEAERDRQSERAAQFDRDLEDSEVQRASLLSEREAMRQAVEALPRFNAIVPLNGIFGMLDYPDGRFLDRSAVLSLVSPKPLLPSDQHSESQPHEPHD